MTTTRTLELLRAVAAWGLWEPPVVIAGSPLPGDEWARLLLGVRRQRLTGMLHAAVAEGSLATTADQAIEAAEAHADDMCEAVALEAVLLEAVAVLEAHHIECRIIKGPAVAHLDYPNPALRSFVDIDLLVRSEHFDAAVAALRAAGYERRFAELRPGFDRHFTKAASFRGPSRRDVDLHRTFVLGPFGLSVDLDAVWVGSTPLCLAGRDLAALTPVNRFGNACLHAVLGDHPPRLVPLRDVVQMTVAGKVDVDAVARLADSWGAGIVLAEALTTCWDTLGLGLGEDQPLVSWARGYRAGAAQRRALAVYQDPRATSASKAVACIRVIPAWRDKLAYVGALMLPQASYLAASDRHHITRWWRSGGELLRDATQRRSGRRDPR